MMNRAGFGYCMIILCLIAGISGCARNKKFQSRADQEFRKGNYEQATFLAVESLKLKPDYRKAQITLKNSYPQAILQRSERVINLQERDDEERWEALLNEYLAMEQLSNAIRSLPPLTNPENGLRISFDLRDYSTQVNEAKQKTANNYYQKGIHQSRMDSSKDGQRIAAEYFKKAMEFVPNYMDSASRYESARSKAVTRIAILPFEDKSGIGNRYGSTADIMMDLILGELMHSSQRLEFTELITRDRIEQVLQEQQLGSSGLIDESSAATIGHLLGAHAILSGKILQINYEAPRISRHDVNETARIQEEDIDEEIQVSCKITQFTRSSTMQFLASYSLVEVQTGKIMAHKNFNPKTSFEGSWARIVEGDARALNHEQIALLKQPEAQPPSATQMYNQVLKDLCEEIVKHLAGYLK